LRNQVPTPAGRGRGEDSATLGEDPARRGKDQPVERGEMFKGDDFRDAVLSRTFPAIRYLDPVRRVSRRAECRVPRDKRERSTKDIRMTHAPAPEFE
jgi:hypothetical protein